MDFTQRQSFGQLLRSYRLAAGLTQNELALRANLSVRGISDLERGVIQAPWPATMLALADALQLSADQREPFLAAGRRITPLLADDQLLAPGQRADVAPVIGRASELALIQRLLADDGPPTLAFYGEPGIGKSRLLAEAEEQARRLGWVTMRGGAERLNGQHPYTPITQALERHFAAQASAQRRRALKGVEWLTRLLPELAADAPLPSPQGWRIPPDQERRLMFSAVERYLARIAEAHGALLILDDMQWAEPDGLSLLGALLRAIGSGAVPRLRVIAAARDLQFAADHPLPQLLAEMARHDLVAWARLAPLAPDDAQALLSASLPHLASIPADERERAIGQVLARSSGVPLYLTSLARELSASWRAGRSALADDDVPWDIAEMTRQRIHALPALARECVAVAAVYGREAPLAILALAGDMTERQVIDAVEAAHAERLLDERPDGSWAFPHDLIRDAALADLSLARRNMLHRRIAEAMETLSGRARIEPLAFHYEQSAQSERAALYHEQAGDLAQTLRAYAAADGHYRDALSHLSPVKDLPTTARVQEKLGDLLMGAGFYDEAVTALEEAAACYERMASLDAVGRIVARIGWAHVRRGTPADGMRRLEPFLAASELERLSVSTRAALWRSCAVLYFALNRYTEQLASAKRATLLAREANDLEALAQAGRLEGLALTLLGRLIEAAPVLEETIRIARTVGDLDSYSAALNDAAAVYRAQGKLKLSWTTSARAVEAVERLGDPMGRAFLTSSLGESAFLLGDWGAARQRMEQAVEIVRDMGASWVAAYPLASLALLNLAEGRDDAATTLLDEASAHAEHDQDMQALRTVHAVGAERDLLRGAPEAALRRLEPLIDRSGVGEKESTVLLPLLSWAYIGLGQPDRAAACLDECGRQVEATGARLVLVDALLTQARLRIDQSAWREAAQALQQAQALASEMGYLYAEAKSLSLQGVAFARQRDKRGAREALRAALAIFDRLGERLYAPGAAALLQRLDATPSLP